MGPSHTQAIIVWTPRAIEGARWDQSRAVPPFAWAL
jgi:hypothetical protein